MECCLELNCSQYSEKISIDLEPVAPSFSASYIADNIALIEDACYTGELILINDGIKVEAIQLFLNGKRIGYAEMETTQQASSTLRMKLVFDGNREYPQPFLLQYDLVILSVQVVLADQTSQQFYSNYLLCLSKHPEDSENVEEIIKELLEFDDDRVNDWIFSNNTQRDAANSLLEGGWRNKAYKSVNSYIQMLEEVFACYKINLPYFRTQAKHTISKVHTLQSHEKVRTISTDGFTWLMQNSHQLVRVTQRTTVNYNGHNYLPLRMCVEETQKNWDNYENQVILGFLLIVCQNAKIIEAEFSLDVVNEERILQRIQRIAHAGYRAPIITIKRLQVAYNQTLLKKLKQIVTILNNMYIQYATALPCQKIQLTHFPRKTKVFQEVKPYNQVFIQIVKWYRFGEFDLRKEKLILQVKTLDKLFEYYCLCQLLKMITQAGFFLSEGAYPVYSHEYHSFDSLYENEREIANTYIFRKDNCYLTLYYQPVIHADSFENDITLFRTTSERGYYSPDFLMKISRGNSLPLYVVMDSKYSTRTNIKQYSLNDLILKYSCQFADMHSPHSAVKMVWLLQGRLDGSLPIFKYHDSPMAKRFPPETFYGIVSINTKVDALGKLWREIEINTLK